MKQNNTASKRVESRVYVGTFGKYSRGSIAGAWLVLQDYSDYDEFLKACKELHKDEENPEFMFQDWENIPEGAISESYLNPTIWEAFDAIESNYEEFATYCNYMESIRRGDDFADVVERFEERRQGEYSSEEDFAEQVAEDTGITESIPEDLRHYFDYSAFARDLFASDYSYCDGYVFCCC